MLDLQSILPPGFRFREAWFPELINGNATLPSSISGGHRLALTGARKGSTVNGLEMRGAELITITDHADIHIADLLTVILPTFRLTTTFDNGAAADMGLMNLNNGSVIARLNSTTGALDFIFNAADGGVNETVSTTKVSWAADTDWQVGFTFAKAATGVISVRLYINGVAENTNDQCDTDLTVPVGNTTLGTDGVTFFTGKFRGMFLVYGTVVLTAAQMLEVSKGIPYATNLQAYLPMDCPGRGLTLTDRSTGGNCSGTISGTAILNIWDFDSRKLVALSCDGINDHAQSASGVDISGAVSIVIVEKMMSTYNALSRDYEFIRIYDAALNNYLYIQYRFSSDDIRFAAAGGGVPAIFITYATKPAMGDYWIMIATLTLAGAMEFYVNGLSVGTNTGVGGVAATAATANIGARQGPARWDVSRPVFAGLVEGALSNLQARDLSRHLNKRLGLGLAI